jgi:hypothetical protein
LRRAVIEAGELVAFQELKDGWYDLPGFRFSRVVDGRIASHVGLEYTHPSMMTLANPMSHPQVGTLDREAGRHTANG